MNYLWMIIEGVMATNLFSVKIKSVYDKLFQLVTGKKVYPYDYFDTFAWFDKTALPSKAAFYISNVIMLF